MNFEQQYYKEIPVRLINRNYKGYSAKRYILGKSNQNVWIPNKHLEEDGTIKLSEDIDYVFWKAFYQNKFRLAGIRFPLVKGRSLFS